MGRKSVAIVGAGPGGLSAAMLLAANGYKVDIYERNEFVGGRTSAFELPGGFTFDLGPTFLMMKYNLEELFTLTGRRLSDYLTLKQIDPLYRLRYGDGREFLPSADPRKTRAEIARLFPGAETGFDRFLEHERKKLERLSPCLTVPYEKYADLLSERIARATPYMDIHVNLFDYLGRYFKEPDLRIAFTFQAKYLGMSPWECPGLFSIISYLEHGMGIYHPIGGLNQISVAMARVVEECGGTIHYGRPVNEVLVSGGRATGLLLADGERVSADDVIINADFAYAMTKLVKPGSRRKYTDKALAQKKYSCSTYMLYLGVDKVYDIPHHSILFANDYKANVADIASNYRLSQDPSVYVQNASVTDPTLAPAGKSTLYVLVPVPNNRKPIDWEREEGAFREKVLDLLEQRGNLPGLRQHIVAQRVITPRFWEDDYNIYRGATFNLAHNIGQMLIWRPHNRFEEFDRCFLVGGGTHPGSGLPTIFESGRITAGIILKRDSWF